MRESPPALTYVPALDGLRALAVAAVVALHSGLPMSGGGGLGVNVFFVLSGFLITAIVLDSIDRRVAFDFRAFITRRLKRLMPALITMLVVVGTFALLAPMDLAPEFGFPGMATSMLIAGTYTANYGIISGFSPGPFFHTWSLGVEMQFYIVWPLLLLFAARAGIRGHRLLVTIATGIVVVGVWRIGVEEFGSADHALYGFDTQADTLLAGAAVAVLHRNGWLPARVLAGLAPFAMVALGALVVVSLGVSQLVHGGYVVIYVLSAILIGHLVSGAPTTVLRPLGHPVLIYVGKLSYSIYLWHFPVFHALTADSLEASRPISIGIRLIVLAVVAVASYHLVEQRLWKRRRFPAAVAQPSTGPS